MTPDPRLFPIPDRIGNLNLDPAFPLRTARPDKGCPILRRPGKQCRPFLHRDEEYVLPLCKDPSFHQPLSGTEQQVAYRLGIKHLMMAIGLS